MLHKFLTAAAFALALAGTAQAQEPPAAQQCAQAWSAVAANETPAALQDFLNTYGACAEADQARQDLVALTEPPTTEEARDEHSDVLASGEDDGVPHGSLGGLIGSMGGSTSGSAHHSHGPNPPPAPPTEQPSQPAPGPSPAEVSTGSGFNIPSDRTVYIPAGRMLMRGQPMIAEGGGYGVILLRRGGAQNLAACQVFVRSLGFSNTQDDGMVEQIDGSYVYHRPIYWPTLHQVSATRASDCPTMLANYDYDRAAIMLARLRSANHGGPFMVIWRADGSSAGLFDYSELPQTELDRQFDRSLFTLAQSDQIWTPSFYQPDVFTRSLRAVLNSVTEPVKYATASLITFTRPSIGLAR